MELAFAATSKMLLTKSVAIPFKPYNADNYTCLRESIMLKNIELIFVLTTVMPFCISRIRKFFLSNLFS
jgi:hypothetical protein